MKIKLTLLLCLLSRAVSAQTIPIACEQYMMAADACIQSSIDFVERVDIKKANELKQAQKDVQSYREDIRKAVAREGSDVVAERCMQPSFVNRMMNGLNGIRMPLMFSGSIDANCEAKFQQIRLAN